MARAIAAGALGVGILFGLSSSAYAQAPVAQPRGAHGRFDGDLVIDVAAGGGIGLVDDTATGMTGTRLQGAGSAEARARYLDSAGLYAGFEYRHEGASRVTVGADFRPLFLLRFFLNAMFADRFWDLLVDSLGLDLGVAILPLDADVGVAFSVGGGFDIPLVFFGESVEGLGLRLYVRHVASLGTDRYGPGQGIHDTLFGGALVFRAQTSLGITAWERSRYANPDR